MKRLSPELRASINAYISEHVSEKVPSGWHSSRDLQRHLNLSPRMTNIIVNRIIEAGDAEVRKFRTVAGQMIRPVPHYHFKPRAAKALGLDKRRKAT